MINYILAFIFGVFWGGIGGLALGIQVGAEFYQFKTKKCRKKKDSSNG
jgi:hypothetical protein